MVLELHFPLQSIGIIGIVIFYIVLARLSARMGEGLMLPSYYFWYYIASIIAISTIPLHIYMHQKYDMQHSPDPLLDLLALYFSLLLLSNIIVLSVSFKYWLWLKDEILGRK